MEQIKKEVKEVRFNVPWGHIAAKAWGSPEKKRILAVHGTLDNAGSFTKFCKLLPDKYYIVVIDLPGHGFSSHHPAGLNLDFFNYILAIKYVLDELDWTSCIYIGHSFGGQLGIIYSIIYPDRLKKIITIDALLPKIVTEENLLKRIKEVLDTTESDHMRRNKADRLYTHDEIWNAMKTRRQFELNDTAIESLLERTVTKVNNHQYKLNRDARMRIFLCPFFNSDQYAELMKYAKTPTLIILTTLSWFDLSKDTKYSLEIARKIIPTNFTIKIAHGNHDIHNNNPERIVDIIVDYIEAVSNSTNNNKNINYDSNLSIKSKL